MNINIYMVDSSTNIKFPINLDFNIVLKKEYSRLNINRSNNIIIITKDACYYKDVFDDNEISLKEAIVDSYPDIKSKHSAIETSFAPCADFDDLSIYKSKYIDELILDIDNVYFEFKFTFSNIDKIEDFLLYYENSSDNNNILNDFYSIKFIPLSKQVHYYKYLKSDRWQEKRQQVLKLASNKCQLCSSVNDLNIHHNTYINVGSEPLEDLVALCSHCHKAIHNLKHVQSRLFSESK